MRSPAVVLAVLLLASGARAASAVPAELPDDYIPFTFTGADSSLVGASEQLAGFTITMDLRPGWCRAGLDSAALFAALRARRTTGTLTYPDGHTTAIAYEIVRHRGPEEIYMKTTLGYFLWEYLTVAGDSLHMAIYWWYSPPATPADLAVLVRAESLLADPDHWRREDDRQCRDDSTSDRWSLFCALKHASVTTLGEYNHHNRALQTVRFVIDEVVPGHGFAHTLMDYNNAATTRHSDILHVLEVARRRLAADLAATTRTSDPD